MALPPSKFAVKVFDLGHPNRLEEAVQLYLNSIHGELLRKPDGEIFYLVVQFTRGTHCLSEAMVTALVLE